MKPELSTFQQALLIILRLEEKRAKLWREELRKMPEGGIIIKPAGGRYYFDRVLSGEKIVWEHLGRLDLLDYRMRNAEKFAAARQGGYVSEEMLIMTVERDLEDGNFIRDIIVRRILPYM